MIMVVVYPAVAIFLLVALIYNVSAGPMYGRASMTGPPDVRYWADALLRLALAGLSLTFLFSGLVEWRGRPTWPRLARRLTAVGTFMCAAGFRVLVYMFHFGPKPAG
jgi:hypothetical protein